MIKKIFCVLSITSILLFSQLAGAEQTSAEAIAVCGATNKPCIALYLRYVYANKNLQECKSNLTNLQSQVSNNSNKVNSLQNDLAQCKSNNEELKNSLAQCQNQANKTPPSPPAPLASDCPVSIPDKSGTLAKLNGMDTTPQSLETKNAISKACGVSTSNISAFVGAFLCAIQAPTSLKSDPQIVGAIDNLENVDLDAPNFCL